MQITFKSLTVGNTTMSRLSIGRFRTQMSAVLLLVTSIFTLQGCEYESMTRYNLGNNFVEDPTSVVEIKTYDISTSTIMYDSIITSECDRMLSGKCKDPIGVETYAECYFRLEPPIVPTFHESSRHDSTVLIMYLDGYWYGDTTKTANFGVYKLTEELEYDYDDSNDDIYSDVKFETEEEPLIKFSINFEDLQGINGSIADSVFVRLPDDLANDFYQMVRDDMEVILNADSFEIKYPGFAIKPLPTDEPTFVVGFNVSPDSSRVPTIRSYYSTNKLNQNFEKDEYYFDYRLLKTVSTSSSAYSNIYVSSYIRNNYDDSPFKGLYESELDIMPSSQTNNMTMIQSGVKVQTRITFPCIEDLYSEGHTAIAKAELYFEPVPGSYEEEIFKIPETLVIYLIDGKNRVLSSTPLPLVNSSYTSYSSLYLPPQEENIGIYKIDVTQFVKDQFQSNSVNDYGLALSLPGESVSTDGNFLTNSVNRLYIGSPDNKSVPMFLKLYMTITE